MCQQTIKNPNAMSKLEMITEVMNACKWCPSTTERNINRAMRRSSVDAVRAIYEAFQKDEQNHPLFYATILAS